MNGWKKIPRLKHGEKSDGKHRKAYETQKKIPNYKQYWYENVRKENGVKAIPKR